MSLSGENQNSRKIVKANRVPREELRSLGINVSSSSSVPNYRDKDEEIYRQPRRRPERQRNFPMKISNNSSYYTDRTYNDESESDRYAENYRYSEVNYNTSSNANST